MPHIVASDAVAAATAGDDALADLGEALEDDVLSVSLHSIADSTRMMHDLGSSGPQDGTGGMALDDAPGVGAIERLSSVQHACFQGASNVSQEFPLGWGTSRAL